MPYHLAELLQLTGDRVVEWESIGTGAPLMWIEGGPGLPAHLARPDVALFADRFECFLVNAPGCGRTSPPSTPDGYGLDDQIRFFDEVRNALGLGRVTLMGHSWGGLVALAFAIAVPDAVQAVVVIEGYAGVATVAEEEAVAERDRAFDRIRGRAWFDRAWAQFLVDDSTGTARDLDERFVDCWPLYFAEPTLEPSLSHVRRLGRETRWNIDAVRAWAPEPPIDLRPELARLACPVLVLVGEHDFICGPVWARAIADATPTATLYVFPGVGHLPQYEAPDEFRRVVLEWFDARADGRAR